MSKPKRQKIARRKKTNSEIKATNEKVKQRKLDAEKKEVFSMIADREDFQRNINEAIQGVATVAKTLGSEDVHDKVPEEQMQECATRIQNFNDIARRVAPGIKDSITKMTDIEKSMLNNPKDRESLMMEYTLTGFPMIESINELTCSSLDTTAYVAGVIETALTESEKTDDKGKTDD